MMAREKTNIVYVLLGINIFMFALIYMYTRYFFPTDPRGETYAFLSLGAESLDLVASGQVWRLVTAAFLHASPFHIIANMYYLYQMGILIETYFGGKKLFLTFILTAITGSLLSVAMAYVFGSSAISVGASGAVFGLFGLIMGSAWRGERQHHTFGIPVDYRTLIPYVLISLVLGFITPGINNAAHVGGFLGGIVLAFVIKPEIGYSSGERSLIEEILFYISVVAFVFSFGALILFNFSI